MRRSPRFVWGAWLCGLMPFLAIAGLCIGLNVQNPPYVTEVITTTAATTTTAPPTTPPLVCPTCNSSYYYPFDIGNNEAQTLFLGQVADYYILGESFTYMNTTHISPYNITLARYSKCTGVEQWSHTLCALYGSYGQYIAIDQTNGDTYFVYQCNGGPNTFLDRYDANGILLWRSNVTTLGGSGTTPIRDLESPITLNYEAQVLYFAFYNGTNKYVVCAQKMLDGTNVWCYSNDTWNSEYSGIVYNNALGLVYLNAYENDVMDNYYVNILNNETGLIVDSFLTVDLKLGIGIDIDSNGGLYFFGRGVTAAEAVVEKFDSAKSLQWRTVISGTSDYYLGFTFGSRDLLYDSVNNIVIVAGDARQNYPGPDFSRNLFIATLDAASGAQLSYYQTPVKNQTNAAFVSIAGDYTRRTVYYNYELVNFTTSLGVWSINSYCY